MSGMETFHKRTMMQSRETTRNDRQFLFLLSASAAKIYCLVTNDQRQRLSNIDETAYLRHLVISSTSTIGIGKETLTPITSRTRHRNVDRMLSIYFCCKNFIDNGFANQ